MKHLGTKIIETERLILRPFTIQDASAMYHNWASDTEVTKYLMWPAHNDISVSERVLKEWVKEYERTDYYQWAIVYKPFSAEPIGSIAVVNDIDDRIKSAHIGYCIGKNFWHLGIVSEALKCVMNFLFNEVGVNRIDSRHDPRNPNSGKVMEKCGMRFEGMLRQSDWNNQGVCDAVYYSILATELHER